MTIIKNFDQIAFILDQMDKPKFNIKDKVPNGEIIEIRTGIFYYHLNYNNDFSHWDNIDIWWKEKHIYTIRLNNPSRYMEYEQYIEKYPEHSRWEYENNIPIVPCLIVIEKQLEDEINESKYSNANM